MKKAIYIIVLCSSFGLFAQNKLERADQFFKDFKFERAISLYSDIANDKRRPSLHVIERLADSYFNTNNYQKAKDWYAKLYSIEGSRMGEANIIKLVQCLKASMQNEDADQLLRDFYSDKHRLSMILAQKEQLEASAEKEPKFTVKNLSFNSEKSDFAPSVYKNQLVFASTRDTVNSKGKIYEWNNQPYLDLYITDPYASQREPSKFLENMESSFHDSNTAFVPDTQTVYFTRNYINKNKLSANKEGLSNMQILKGTISNNVLTDISSLSFNSKEYSCGHPALGPEGKYLYFTSNMPGGHGGSDLYVVALGMDGDAMGPPKNLGPNINTKGREMFPHVNGDTLYFASDSHYGLGGLDLFSTIITSTGAFSLPMNMGAPINSNMDDFSMVYDNEKEHGYMASNRFGGIGDDDIYEVQKAQAINCLEYSGHVLNKETKQPIPQAGITLQDRDGTVLQQLESDGEGFFALTLPCNKDNKVVFTKAGFTKEEIVITTGENPQEPSKDNTIFLTPFESLVVKEGDVEKIKVNPIYFEYDKYDITPRAEIELEKVLYAMEEFPGITIKIESHTDSRGTEQYNFKLSDNRAKSTRRYLISKGIAPNRIVSAKGYGEYHLINRCSDGVQCSEQEHLINRRSDFIIVEKSETLENVQR